MTYPLQPCIYGACREMHPAWEYKLWTDEANRKLVKEHYPWLLETYDSFPENIMRADTARVLYMHHYGGKFMISTASPLRIHITNCCTSPSFTQLRGRLPERMMRMMKLSFLLHVAGLYADLDFEVLQPFDNLITKESLVLAAMTDDISFNHRIPNAWMASAPKHPFWHFCMQHIIAASTPCAWQPKKKYVTIWLSGML